MACTNCSTTAGNAPGCQSKGSCSTGNCGKMPVFNWLSNMSLPSGQEPFNIIEVRFKNGRKEFFLNKHNLSVQMGDTVAVEGSPGHDIGVVSLKGELVRLQMRKKKIKEDSEQVKVLYRHASESDIEKWALARERETPAMYKAREIASNLKLDMKIGDVEFQGDNIKAVFYYTSEGRVDFRELIKLMADEFKVRIEMRQIGARQEAQRMGGIGSCGRELCCSTWLNDFRSVSTSAARYQQLSLNPQKLAGQCGKLKCCLNYELDMYVEALKDFPDTNLKLKTKKGDAFQQKMDIFRRKAWYSYRSDPSKFIELNLDKVQEIIALNKQEKEPESLEMYVQTYIEVAKPDYENVVGQDSITRFDKQASSKRTSNKKRSNRNTGNKKPAQGNPKVKTEGAKPVAKNPNQGQTKSNPQAGNSNNSPNQKQGVAKPKRQPSRQRRLLKPNENKATANNNNENKKPE
jgi:cell fate regulator YaaT (PSP1 superfamily)